MPLPISATLPVAAPDAIRPAGAPASPAGGSDFRSLFEGAVNRVEQSQKLASASADRFLSGEGEEVHETALAAERAELTFNLFLQTRNKVVSAYQEIMRMQM